MNDTHNRVQERFGTYAQNYVTSAVHGASYTLDRLIELLEPLDGKRALDVATGGGHVALAMARKGAQVIASDLTVPMLQAARNYIDAQGVPMTYARVDGQRLPFADNSLDVVTCRLAPHHFPDIREFISECARVIRPGGVVGIVDHAGATNADDSRYVNAYERLRDPSHVWEYNEREWQAFFAEVGLQAQHTEVARTRLNFNWWTQMQNNDAETVLRLRIMLRQAPKSVAQWLEPDMPEGGEASFTRWQIILTGMKV
ncbi:MAG: class I SAM-dependent methyltransferase [Anaerolineae bacterium]|nr:class I SAM-dependent methyltransferase [Anaerolineae bacterium]